MITYHQSLAFGKVFVEDEGKDSMPKERLLCIIRHVVRVHESYVACVSGNWYLEGWESCRSEVTRHARCLVVDRRVGETREREARQGSLNWKEPPCHVNRTFI